MGNPQFTGLSTKALNKALQADKVTNALEARAARVLPRARALAYQAGARQFAQQLHIVSGTRPGLGAVDGLKRPYARVSAALTDEQVKADRGAKLTRRQILRRAGHGS